jgi:hypothetical protein
MIDRQIRNHHSEPLRGDPRQRIGRQRQESLSLRRTMRPEPTYSITAPLGYVRRQAGAGSVYAALWASGKYYAVGRCTCQGNEITIVWNADERGRLAQELHEYGRLVFTPSKEAGSLVAVFNGTRRR